MAVGMLFEMPGGTQQGYDDLNREMFGSSQPGELPDGLIFHCGGPTAGGWRVFDVWESREAFQRFAQAQLMPAAQKLGLGQMGEPDFFPIHNMMKD